MLFAGKIKLLRDSKEIRRAKKALEKEFTGQWYLNSDLPLRGTLIIKKGKAGYQGIFKVIQPFAQQDAIILKKIKISGNKIGFSMSTKDLSRGLGEDRLWIFFGELQQDRQHILGDVHDRALAAPGKGFNKLIWSARKGD